MWYNAYNIEFRDDLEQLWNIMIQSQDPVEECITLEPSRDPLEWEGSAKCDQTEVMLGTTGKLEVIITEDTLSELAAGKLIPTTVTDRRIIVQREGETVWIGWIIPESYDQDWVAPEFEFQLSICDSVEVLKYIYVTTEDTSTNIIQFLYSAYQKGGGELPFGDFLRTNRDNYYAKNGASYNKHWGSASLYPSYFSTSENSEGYTYYDVIEILLCPYGRLMQTGQRWFVGTESVASNSIYKPNVNSPSRFTPCGSREVVDFSSLVDADDNKISILPPPSKVTVSYTTEEGSEDYSEDSVFKFDKDYINTSVASGFGDTYGLRYLFIPSNRVDLPITLSRGMWVMQYPYYRNTSGEWFITANGQYTLLNTAVPGSYECCQALEYTNGSWTTKKALCFGQYRWMDTEAFADKLLWKVAVDTFAIQKRILSSDDFGVMLKCNFQLPDLATEAVWWKGSVNCVRPYVQVYYTNTLGGTPTHILNWDGNNLTWVNCNGFFVPTYEQNSTTFLEGGEDEGNEERRHISLIPSSRVNSGLYFSVPNNGGYLYLRLFAGSWLRTGLDNKIIMNDTHKNIISAPVIVSDLELTYRPIISDPRSALLEYNDDKVNEKTYTLNGGKEDLDLTFKTLANEDPSARYYFAPSRGFDDRMDKFVTGPREKLSVGEVRLENNTYLTMPVTFKFDGKIYFPMSIGMNAASGRAKLLLIRNM